MLWILCTAKGTCIGNGQDDLPMCDRKTDILQTVPAVNQRYGADALPTSPPVRVARAW